VESEIGRDLRCSWKAELSCRYAL